MPHSTPRKRKVSEPRRTTANAPYHHGDLAPVLRESARAILEERGPEGLSLRDVAKRAGVSHTAPYRHYASREALLADIAREGLERLGKEVIEVAQMQGSLADRIAHIGAAYARFAVRHANLLRLMFGPEFSNRDAFPELTRAADLIAAGIGDALGDQALGLAVWATVHGLTMLIVENMIDLGQRQSGLDVVPSRAEIVLRSLFAFTER